MTTKHVMKLHPFYEVAANAERKIAEGWTIYEQWNCAHCGTKQTMPDANKFYTRGNCEECGKETNIEQDGCNFMAVSSTAESGRTVADLLKDVKPTT